MFMVEYIQELIRMSNKNKCINNVINRFSDNAREVLLKQIELFYDADNQITKKQIQYR